MPVWKRVQTRRSVMDSNNLSNTHTMCNMLNIITIFTVIHSKNNEVRNEVLMFIGGIWFKDISRRFSRSFVVHHGLNATTADCRRWFIALWLM